MNRAFSAPILLRPPAPPYARLETLMDFRQGGKAA